MTHLNMYLYKGVSKQDAIIGNQIFLDSLKELGFEIHIHANWIDFNHIDPCHAGFIVLGMMEDSEAAEIAKRAISYQCLAVSSDFIVLPSGNVHPFQDEKVQEAFLGVLVEMAERAEKLHAAS